jgi:hypothetical protein
VPEELAAIYGWLAHYERFWKARLQTLTDLVSSEPAADPASAPAHADRPEQTSTADAKEPTS